MIVEQQVMVWCTDGECKMQSELQIARQTINNLYVLHLHHLFPFLGFKAHGPFCWPYLTFSVTADVCNSKKVFWKGWKFYWSVFMSYRQQPYPLPAGTILWAAPQGSQANLSYPKVPSRHQTCHWALLRLSNHTGDTTFDRGKEPPEYYLICQVVI